MQLEPRHCRDKLILHPEVKTDIQSALRALEKRADLERVWNLSSIQPMQGRYRVRPKSVDGSNF